MSTDISTDMGRAFLKRNLGKKLFLKSFDGKRHLVIFMAWIFFKLGLRNRCYKCDSELIEHYHPEPITDRDYVYSCLKGCFILLFFILLVSNNANADQNIVITFRASDDIINQGLPLRNNTILNSSGIDVIGWAEDIRVLNNYSGGFPRWALITFINNGSTSATIRIGKEFKRPLQKGINYQNYATWINISNGILNLNISKDLGKLYQVRTDLNKDGNYTQQWLRQGIRGNTGFFNNVTYNSQKVSTLFGGPCDNVAISNGTIMLRFYMECNMSRTDFKFTSFKTAYEFIIFNNTNLIDIKMTLINMNRTAYSVVVPTRSLYTFFDSTTGRMNRTTGTFSKKVPQLYNSTVGSIGNSTHYVNIDILDINLSSGGLFGSSAGSDFINLKRWEGISFGAGLSRTDEIYLTFTRNFQNFTNFTIRAGRLPYQYWIDNSSFLSEYKASTLSNISGYGLSIANLYSRRIAKNELYHNDFSRTSGTSRSKDGWILENLLRHYMRTGNLTSYDYAIKYADLISDMHYQDLTNLSSNALGGVAYWDDGSLYTHGGYQRPLGLIVSYYMTGNLRYKRMIDLGKTHFYNEMVRTKSNTTDYISILNQSLILASPIYTHREGVNGKYFLEYYEYQPTNLSMLRFGRQIISNVVTNLLNNQNALLERYNYNTKVISTTLVKELMHDYTREGIIKYKELNSSDTSFNTFITNNLNWAIQNKSNLDREWWYFRTGGKDKYSFINIWSAYTFIKLNNQIKPTNSDNVKKNALSILEYWIADQNQDGGWYDANETGNTQIDASYMSIAYSPYVIQNLSYPYLLKFLYSTRTFNTTTGTGFNLTFNKYDNYYFAVNRNNTNNKSRNIVITFASGDDVYELTQHLITETNTDGLVNFSVPTWRHRVYTVQPLDTYMTKEGRNFSTMNNLTNHEIDIYVPVYFTSSSTSTLKKIASNLSQAINATVRMNVAHTNIKDIVFINNNSRDYSPETWNFVGGQAEMILNNIAPDTNTVYIDYGTQPLGQQQTIKGRGILRFITEELPISLFGSKYSLPAWVAGIMIISLVILTFGLFAPISFPVVITLLVINALLIFTTISRGIS